jgi:dTMP kinase
MKRGQFITFEGIDGAGKSTQIAFLADHLRAQGHTVRVTREPGGTPLGESLRTLILNRPMDPRTETLLVFAARAEHLAQVIRPALAAGHWVVCDRFTDATYAYQSGGRGLPGTDIETLAHWVHPDLQPDRTVLVDVPPEVAAARLASARAADRFEAEQGAFFARVRDAYLERAQRDPQRFVILDGTLSPAAIQAQIVREFT